MLVVTLLILNRLIAAREPPSRVSGFRPVFRAWLSRLRCGVLVEGSWVLGNGFIHCTAITVYPRKVHRN